VKGYAQVFGVDFSETFALVALLDTIKLLLALSTQNDWKVYHLDVKSAFLNGYMQEEIFICQKKYAKEILKTFHMNNCKSTSTPMNLKEKFSKNDGINKVDEGQYRSLIRCLMYLTITRSDIAFVVSLHSRFMHCASELHLQGAKRIVRYIKGIINYGIKFSHLQNFKLHGYSNSDWVRIADDMKSTSGYCFRFGSGMFSWCSRK
jgi:hypothetical protein